jgi:hypothetical protein
VASFPAPQVRRDEKTKPFRTSSTTPEGEPEDDA